jgi:hypothetical protein
MAKQSGIGANLYVGTADLSGDVGAVTSIETSVGTYDVTAINDSAMERITGRRDGAMAFDAFWNATAGQSHPVLSALPRTDVICSCFIGSTVGYPGASMTAKQVNYAPTLGADGSLGVAVGMQANGYGLEWGEMLTTGKQSFATGTVDGTSIDLGSTSTLFGAAAYLHVFSVASGTATFHVQDSDDNSTFADVTGLVFTGATGATTQRLQTAAGATIRQYVRVEGTGVHGAAVVAVNFVRYTEAGPI